MTFKTPKQSVLRAKARIGGHRARLSRGKLAELAQDLGVRDRRRQPSLAKVHFLERPLPAWWSEP
jgi:hypothetical protein